MNIEMEVKKGYVTMYLSKNFCDENTDFNIYVVKHLQKLKNSYANKEGWNIVKEDKEKVIYKIITNDEQLVLLDPEKYIYDISPITMYKAYLHFSFIERI